MEAEANPAYQLSMPIFLSPFQRSAQSLYSQWTLIRNPKQNAKSYTVSMIAQNLLLYLRFTRKILIWFIKYLFEFVDMFYANFKIFN